MKEESPMRKKTTADPADSSFDEEAAIEAAQERTAVPHLRDVLRRERDEILKGRPRNEALENRGSEIEEMILRDLVACKE
jgi:hypothetical protein